VLLGFHCRYVGRTMGDDGLLAMWKARMAELHGLADYCNQPNAVPPPLAVMFASYTMASGGSVCLSHSDANSSMAALASLSAAHHTHQMRHGDGATPCASMTASSSSAGRGPSAACAPSCTR
jgi:hypothetical protein